MTKTTKDKKAKVKEIEFTEEEIKEIEEGMQIQQKKHSILVFSVIGVSLFIIILWGLAFRNQIINFSWENTSEKILITNAQEIWEEANSNTNEKELVDNELNKAKEEAKKILIDLLEEVENENNLENESTANTSSTTTDTKSEALITSTTKLNNEGESS